MRPSVESSVPPKINFFKERKERKEWGRWKREERKKYRILRDKLYSHHTQTRAFGTCPPKFMSSSHYNIYPSIPTLPKSHSSVTQNPSPTFHLRLQPPSFQL
jgi:hypothetical protein